MTSRDAASGSSEADAIDEGPATAAELAEAEAIAATTVAPSSSPSLDKSLVMGIAWTGGMKWATQLVSWVSTIIVARLLSPADYGVMGMAAVYVNLVMLVNEFGLTAVILQRRDLTKHQIGQVGGFGVMIGLGFTLISMLLAWPVAHFFGDMAVRTVIMLLSLNFTIAAFAVLPRALLARDLQFDRLALIDGLTSLSQAAITITLAFLGWRYFSLVFSSLVSGLIGLTVALIWRRSRIVFPHPLHEVRKLINVGWHVVVGRVAWYTYQNADFAVVGRVLGKVMLGVYTVGWEIATVPVERVSALVGQVTPSIFSSVQHDRPALRRYYLGIVSGLSLITFPAAIGLAMVAKPLVLTLLGAKWLPAVGPLQILAAYAGIRSIDTVTPTVLIFTGQSRKSMWFSVGAALILPFLFYIGTRWGTVGVAATWVIAYPLIMAPAYRLLFKVLEMPAVDYFKNLWPAVSSTAIMAAALWVARPFLSNALPGIAALIAEIVTGAVVYAAVLFGMHRERLYAFKRIIQRARA